MTDARLSQEARTLVEKFHDACVYPKVCLNFYLRLDPNPLYSVSWNAATAGEEILYLHKGCKLRIANMNRIRKECSRKVVIGLDDFLCRQ
jgi:hypothetical protein